MCGEDDRENILRARASGNGVLTSPFKLLKSNHLGVVLTFAVYDTDLPPGAIVTCVESGKAALAILKLKPPHNFDACFMDLQMPEMDGFEATRRVRDIERDVNK